MIEDICGSDLPDLSRLEYGDCRAITVRIYEHFDAWRCTHGPLAQFEIVESIHREFESVVATTSRFARLRARLLAQLLGPDITSAIRDARQLAEDTQYVDCYINLRELGACEFEEQKLSCYADLAGKAVVDAFGGRLRFGLWLVRCLALANARTRLTKGWLRPFLLDDRFAEKAYLVVKPFFDAAELPLSQACWLQATEYLRPRFRQVLAAMPVHIRQGDGFAKLLKVLGGVIAHGMSALPPACSGAVIESTFIRCIKVGFCWGVTYPLLDDVIDSRSRFPAPEIASLKGAVASILSGGNVGRADLECLNHLPHATGLIESLMELRTLVPYEENITAYRLMHLAHMAQNEDSELTIDGSHGEREIFVASTLKAALVRVATALVAGAHVDQALLRRAFLLAPFNQGEDDFQDFLDDLQTGAVTPFTAFACGLFTSNPVHLFLFYGRYALQVLGAGDMARKVIDRQTLEIVKNLCAKHTQSGFVSSVLGRLLSSGDGFSGNLQRLLERVSERVEFMRYIDGETTLTRLITGAVQDYDQYSNSSA